MDYKPLPDPLPVYCTKCGKKLKNITKRQEAGYDMYTGKQLERVVEFLICPAADKPWTDKDDDVSAKERHRMSLHDFYVLSDITS